MGNFRCVLPWKKERRRLGIVDIQYTQKEKAIMNEQAATVEEYSYKRPKLLWINFLLTLTLLVCLIMELMPLPVLFTVAFAIAVMINYPSIEEQKNGLLLMQETFLQSFL